MTPKRKLTKQQQKKMKLQQQQSLEQASSNQLANEPQSNVPAYTGPRYVVGSYTYEELCLARELVDMVNEAHNCSVAVPLPAHVAATSTAAEQLPKQLVEPRLRRDGMVFTREKPSPAHKRSASLDQLTGSPAQDMPSAGTSACEGVLDLSLKKTEDNNDQEASNQAGALSLLSQQSQYPKE